MMAEKLKVEPVAGSAQFLAPHDGNTSEPGFRRVGEDNLGTLNLGFSILGAYDIKPEVWPEATVGFWIFKFERHSKPSYIMRAVLQGVTAVKTKSYPLRLFNTTNKFVGIWVRGNVETFKRIQVPTIQMRKLWMPGRTRFSAKRTENPTRWPGVEGWSVQSVRVDRTQPIIFPPETLVLFQQFPSNEPVTFNITVSLATPGQTAEMVRIMTEALGPYNVAGIDTGKPENLI